MKRTQIYLTEEEQQALDRLSEQKGTSKINNVQFKTFPNGSTEGGTILKQFYLSNMSLYYKRVVQLTDLSASLPNQ